MTVGLTLFTTDGGGGGEVIVTTVEVGEAITVDLVSVRLLLSSSVVILTVNDKSQGRRG